MKIDPTDLLFADRFAPITSNMGFIEAGCTSLVREFTAWHDENIKKMALDIRISVNNVSGDLKSVLEKLLPLRMADSNRYLFIPTASNWTAYLDNGYRGTDGAAIGYLAERLKCRSLWIVAIPHTLQNSGAPRRGRQGALIFELYGAEKTHWLNLIRLIRLDNDAGKWEFQQDGAPLPFEEVEQYTARRVSERFSFESFRRYLEALGIAPFDENYYLPPKDKAAILVELKGQLPRNAKNISLKRARRLNGIEEGVRIFGRLISRNGYF